MIDRWRLTLIICMLCVVGFSKSIAFADTQDGLPSDTVSISIPDTWALPGETITIPIVTSSVDAEDFITSIEGSITFDANILTLLDLEKEGTVTEVWTLLDPMFNMVENTLFFAFPGEYPIKGSGALLILVFEVSALAQVGQATQIQFNTFSLNEGLPHSVTYGALFTVGESPQIELSESEHDFGTVDVGKSSEWQFSITNLGPSELRILDIFPDYTQFLIDLNVFPFTLQTGENQDIHVAFQPTAEDSLEGRIRITSNDPQKSIAVIVLSGVGSNGTSVDEPLELNQCPESYELFQNYPNPFNPSTDIKYQIVDSGSPIHTTLKVYNVLGQEIQTLVNSAQESGLYTVTWDTHDEQNTKVPSGIYFYTLEAGDFLTTKKMVYIR